MASEEKENRPNDITGESSTEADPPANPKDDPAAKEVAVPEEAEASKDAATEQDAKSSTQADETTKTSTVDNEDPAAVPRRPTKRARTAYFIFADEVRKTIQQEHPGEGVASQAKRIGARWKALGETEKERFKEMALKEKESVKAALEAYQKQFGTGPLDEEAPNGEGGSNDHDLVFPVARIRKIAKLDPEVKTLSKEALQLVVKSTELALARLGREAVKVARIHNRRTLLADDVAHVCEYREPFQFLKDDLKDLVKAMAKTKEQQQQEQSSSETAKASAATSKTMAAAAGSKPLTAYFGAVTKK